MIKDGFIYCPVCGRKTRTKITQETKLGKFPLYCHFCKQTTVINAESGKVEVDNED